MLTTINARHSHAALGLRYLKANAGPLAERIAIVELVLGADVETMARRLLGVLAPRPPRIIGLGVYVWNVVASTALAARLRELAPDAVLVAGGPEVSHELEQQPIAALVDYVVQGPGDLAFARLATAILNGPRPLQRVISGDQPADLGELVLPYPLYDAYDIARRHLYVEASRGCPFKCAFCLSALDRTAWPFPVPPLLSALEDLHRRGARRFRFVDRTFNLRLADSARILEFFLERITAQPDDPCFVHFELIPDRLPPALREPIARFPPGTLQFEIGIQTFDPEVQRSIDRRQDNAAAEANLRWLRAETHAHLHVDLIAGLPGEGLAGFAAGYDRLRALRPHEIQLGLLKRLRGAPIIRHENAGRLVFETVAPYRVTRTDALSECEIAEFEHIARVHDRVVNSGRMPELAAAVLDSGSTAAGPAPATAPDISVSAFARLRALSATLVKRFGRSHGIGLEPLVDAVRDFAVDAGLVESDRATAMAIADYRRCGAHGRLNCMARGLTSSRPNSEAFAPAATVVPAERTPDSDGMLTRRSPGVGGIRLAACEPAAALPRQRRHRRKREAV
ncbi:MAG: radical SAM protein [Burkholderiaceae bacterium]